MIKTVMSETQLFSLFALFLTKLDMRACNLIWKDLDLKFWKVFKRNSRKLEAMMIEIINKNRLVEIVNQIKVKRYLSKIEENHLKQRINLLKSLLQSKWPILSISVIFAEDSTRNSKTKITKICTYTMRALCWWSANNAVKPSRSQPIQPIR